MKLGERYRAYIARQYDSGMVEFERKYFAKLRVRLITPLSGNVLELGAGTGANLPYYQPAKITHLTLTEPDPYMYEVLEGKAAKYNLPIKLQQSGAEKLPYADNEFDYVVTTLVFCTVPQVALALAEVKRVLKPGGEFHFFEHVRSKHLVFAGLQTALNPLWGLGACGCRLNRNTAANIEKAGFKFNQIEQMSISWSPIRPCIIGAATPL